MEKRDPSQLNNDTEMIFGTRAVMESIHAGKEVEKLFIQKGLNNALIKELVVLARENQVPLTFVPAEKLNRLTRKNHQGVVGQLSAVSFFSLDNIITRCYQDGRDPFIIILDRVTDVRNFGAIARSAECAGVDALVIPSRGSARIGSDAIKTSAGALHHIPVCRSANLKDTLIYLKETGLNLVACTEKTDTLLYDMDLTGPLAILLGSEEDGISPEYLKIVHQKGKFPVFGHISSLNVSVAAALVIYEGVRQRTAT